MDRGAGGAEDVEHGYDIGGLTADHDRQGSCDRTFLASADRGIDHDHVVGDSSRPEASSRTSLGEQVDEMTSVTS